MHDTVTNQLRNLNDDSDTSSTDTEIDSEDVVNEELGTDRSDDGDLEEDKESKKFPVADLSKILEVQGKHAPLTKERKQWRAWLREQCKNRLTEDVLAYVQTKRKHLSSDKVYP